MEIRTLRYFLAVAREENMTRAAEDLKEIPLFCSEQAWNGDIRRWAGGSRERPCVPPPGAPA